MTILLGRRFVSVPDRPFSFQECCTYSLNSRGITLGNCRPLIFQGESRVSDVITYDVCRHGPLARKSPPKAMPESSLGHDVEDFDCLPHEGAPVVDIRTSKESQYSECQCLNR